MGVEKKDIVEIFTDGACSGNPGPGGYGAILRYGRETKEISGCQPQTTNNRMEMMAVIEALRLIKRPSKIIVRTDSNYVIKGMTEWIFGWVRRNWVNSKKKPVLNRDLWEILLALSKSHEIEWKWIKGHFGHKENERCDALARKAIRKCRQGTRERHRDMDERWLQILGTMTYGIYLLTSYHGREINGMIASWVSQVSYDPPMVIIAVHQSRYSLKLIQKSGCFALHLLSQNQKDLLSRFKGPDLKMKFSSIQWTKGKTGCPILTDCLGYLECEVTEAYTPGNHTLFIGKVVDAQLSSHEEPMNTFDYDGFYTGRD